MGSCSARFVYVVKELCNQRGETRSRGVALTLLIQLIETACGEGETGSQLRDDLSSAEGGSDEEIFLPIPVTLTCERRE
jgi:hypothetical protein